MGPFMMIHIAAGAAALLAGAAALAVRKGGRWHARIGNAFFGSMLVMGSTGAVIAALKPERGSMLVGVTVCYLIATAWVSARHRDGRAGRFEYAALAVILAVAIAQLTFGFWAFDMPRGRFDSLPWQVHFVFGGLAVLAAALDINFIRRRVLSGVQRIGRHLWRMTTALLIATSAFFNGQRDEFPREWQDSILLSLPTYAVLAALFFWIIRVRFGAAFRKWPPRPPVAET